MKHEQITAARPDVQPRTPTIVEVQLALYDELKRDDQASGDAMLSVRVLGIFDRAIARALAGEFA